MPPRPFRIDVPDSVLDDLRERLGRTRWPDAIPDTGWDYGADVAYVRELCDYWRNEYDWRAQEAALNAWPQFLYEVDGVDIHFWHVRGNGPDPHPLVLTHGWPGSIFEFLHLIGPLTEPAARRRRPRRRLRRRHPLHPRLRLERQATRSGAGAPPASRMRSTTS